MRQRTAGRDKPLASKRCKACTGAERRRAFITLVVLCLVPVLGWWPLELRAAEAPIRLLALGDSLTAGYGLAPAQAFPAQLERALRGQALDVTVENAGVSGDTSAGGRARLAGLLAASHRTKPDAVIVELGINDAFRGIDPEVTCANLDAILEQLSAHGIPVLLAGMRLLPRWGIPDDERFASLYPRVAARHGVALYPFFLEGVAGERSLNLPDGLHPNARGIAEIVRRITPAVLDLVRSAKENRERGR